MSVTQVTTQAAHPVYVPTGSPVPWRSKIAKIGGRSRQLGLRVARLILQAVAESQMRRAARELRRLDDRTLRDIGVTRSEIDYVVRYGRDGDLVMLRIAFGLPGDGYDCADN